MWGVSNVWGEGRNVPMASYHAVVHDIHVLLVDHESESLINTAKLLEMCQYKVTLVELASAAITMLTSGKVKFDIVMTNINSPDLHGFKLVQHAVSMDLPIILMSVDDNMFMATRALENGAFLYIQKPVTIEIVRCLWQHVMREKTRMLRERDRLAAAASYNVRGIEFREPIQQGEEVPINMGGDDMYMLKNKGKSKKKDRERNEEYEMENHMGVGNKFKRKVCTEWTQELHAKFVDAIEQLGEGRCFPKEILDLMNVPGLTRMQVASHLQKCRNDNWKSPEERKSQVAASSDTDGSQSKPRRFGSMPRLCKAPFYNIQVHQNSGAGQSSQTRSVTEMATKSAEQGNVGIGPVVNTITTHHQPFGSMLPGPSQATPGQNSSLNDFFNFPEMDSLIQNLSGLPQASGANNPNSDPGAYHFGPIYPEQNSGGQSVDTRSQWSSETSTFGSDESEMRGRE